MDILMINRSMIYIIRSSGFWFGYEFFRHEDEFNVFILFLDTIAVFDGAILEDGDGIDPADHVVKRQSGTQG